MLRSLFSWIRTAAEPADSKPISDAPAQDSSNAVATLEPPADASHAQPSEAEAQSAAAGDTPPWWVARGEPVIQPRNRQQGLQAVDAELYADISRVLDNPDIELPQLPSVAKQVLEMLADPDVNLAEAAGVAEQDPVLTAEILRLVNSVAYRAVREVERLSLAFPRLGVRRLRAVLVSATMKSLAVRGSQDGKSLGAQLWRGACAGGVVASETADRLKMPADEAYLSGLLHDIGSLVLLKILHDYQQRSGKKLTRALFAALCDRWHEHLGLRLADAWQLPDPLPELIGNHHRPPAEHDPLARPRLLLAFSDAVCSMLEYSPYIPYDFFNLPCVMRLGFVDDAPTRSFLATLPAAIEARLGV